LIVKITEQTIKKVAELSRLKFEGRQTTEFLAQFSSIIEFVNQINAVDAKDIKVTYEVTGLKNIFREDKIECLDFDRGKLLINTPILEGTEIIVPAVFGEKNDK